MGLNNCFLVSYRISNKIELLPNQSTKERSVAFRKSKMYLAQGTPPLLLYFTIAFWLTVTHIDKTIGLTKM